MWLNESVQVAHVCDNGAGQLSYATFYDSASMVRKCGEYSFSIISPHTVYIIHFQLYLHYVHLLSPSVLNMQL